MKILLVDDSRTIRNIQKNILAGLGHTDVVEAADGVEALGKINAQSPDLMLVDWNMPNMDGVTLVKTLRRQGLTFPVIMCTTEAEKARAVQALQAGATSYVVKPFSTETMARKITQTMQQVGACASA